MDKMTNKVSAITIFLIVIVSVAIIAFSSILVTSCNYGKYAQKEKLKDTRVYQSVKQEDKSANKNANRPVPRQHKQGNH